MRRFPNRILRRLAHGYLKVVLVHSLDHVTPQSRATAGTILAIFEYETWAY
jgi:hypothetical protein